jgi:hypothetical protein
LIAHGEKIDRRRLIRPDARAVINKTAFWIEFDNNMERTRKLEVKFQKYVQALTLVRNQDPVVWVAANRNRKEYLGQSVGSGEECHYEGRVDIPEIYFFVEGEELNPYFFISYPLHRRDGPPNGARGTAAATRSAPPKPPCQGPAPVSFLSVTYLLLVKFRF